MWSPMSLNCIRQTVNILSLMKTTEFVYENLFYVIGYKITQNKKQNCRIVKRTVEGRAYAVL